MAKKKVFIGLQDIASFFDDWASGFRENGFEVIVGSHLFQSSITSSKVNFVLRKEFDKVGYFKPGMISSRVKPMWDNFIRRKYLRRMIKECDVFLFIWESFYPNCSDYQFLSQKGKKLITVLVGDEVRWEPAMKQEFISKKLNPFTYLNYSYSDSALTNKLRYLRTAEKYSGLILSQPNISQLGLRPYKNLFIPINLKEYPISAKQRLVPKLVHAPTSIGKGTAYIEEAVEQLKKEGYNFDYVRIENKPRSEALKIYNDADIIVDQLLLPGGGKLAHEGLALGKVVLTCMAYSNYEQRKPKDCPLVDVRVETLLDVLKNLIPNQITRQQIADKGRPYIKKHHDPETIVREVLKDFETKALPEDYIKPTFFREEYVPEKDSKLKLYNNWTDYVKKEEWYINNIKPGQREGLVF